MDCVDRRADICLSLFANVRDRSFDRGLLLDRVSCLHFFLDRRVVGFLRCTATFYFVTN